MKNRTKAKLSLALLIGMGLALATAGVATNAVSIPTTRTTSPGAGYHWGVQWNSTNWPNAGGVRAALSYSGAGFTYGGYNTYPQVLATGRNNTTSLVTPVLLRVTEPFNHTGSGVKIAFWGLAYAEARSGCCSGATVYIGPINQVTGVNDGALYCSTTEWALASAFIKKPQTFSYSNTDFSGIASSELPIYTSATFAADCPYIQGFKTYVCYYATTAATVYTCLTLTWSAEAAFAKSSYAAPDPGTLLCGTAAAGTVSVECQYSTPGTGDPTDYNQVCVKNAPTVAWLDFSWLPNFVTFYGSCLLVPRGGFDRSGVIAAAIASGQAHVYQTAISTAATSLTVYESCGNLIGTVTVPGLEGFGINTCNWTWAPPFKSFLSIAIPALSGAAVLVYLLALIAGMFGTRSPMAATETDD